MKALFTIVGFYKNGNIYQPKINDDIKTFETFTDAVIEVNTEENKTPIDYVTIFMRDEYNNSLAAISLEKENNRWDMGYEVNLNMLKCNNTCYRKYVCA